MKDFPMTPTRRALRALTLTLLGATCLAAFADDAAIRKAWAERNPTAPAIDEISKTPIPGLFELRIGNELIYSNENGDYLMFPAQDAPEGHIIETKTHNDVTAARIDKLIGFDVASLPFKDAIMRKQGTGARRLVVFEDPNCHFCKDVEKSLVELKDVTIYTFLIPILGDDSVKKSRDIWCSKDAAKTWISWMLQGQAPQREMGSCDTSALQRNLALAEKHRVVGTPAIVFEDGTRVPGMADLPTLQKRIDDVAAGRSGKKS